MFININGNSLFTKNSDLTKKKYKANQLCF